MGIETNLREVAKRCPEAGLSTPRRFRDEPIQGQALLRRAYPGKGSAEVDLSKKKLLRRHSDASPRVLERLRVPPLITVKNI